MKKILSFLFLTIFAVSAPTFSEAKNNKHHGKDKHKVTKVVVHKRPAQRVVVRNNVSPPDNGAPVMSRACPFSCRTENISKDHCRDWREGNICYVQDTWDSRARLYWPNSFNTGYYPYREPLPSVGERVGRELDRAVNNSLR